MKKNPVSFNKNKITVRSSLVKLVTSGPWAVGSSLCNFTAEWPRGAFPRAILNFKKSCYVDR